MNPADIAADNQDRGRFSARRKTKAILRLLRGEDIDLISRELGVTAATVSGWRDHFLAGGQAALKTRQQDEREDEIHRLKAKIGDQTMATKSPPLGLGSIRVGRTPAASEKVRS